tara:strand:- start:1424 stop:1927 length:504 start_codon:yes stop_codon:yes gene_type:complete
LGTSTAAEAKEYFGDLDKHQIKFAQISKDVRIKSITMADVVMGDDDDEDLETLSNVTTEKVTGDDLIDMAFSKARVEDRKVWLNGLKIGTNMDYAKVDKNEGVKYSEFINKELILFSCYDNQVSERRAKRATKPTPNPLLRSARCATCSMASSRVRGKSCSRASRGS